MEWILTPEEVAARVRVLGLEPEPWSPLGELPEPDGAPEASGGLDAALEVLARPSWEIVRVAGLTGLLAVTRLYAAEEGEAHWVRLQQTPGRWVVALPDDPVRVRDTTLAALAADSVTRASSEAWTLAPEALLAVAALADLRAAVGDRAFRASPADLAEHLRRRSVGPSEGSYRWDWLHVASTYAAGGPPATAGALEAGFDRLVEERRILRLEGRPAAGPELRLLLRELGRPRAFAALRTTHRDGPKMVTEALTVLRTDDRLLLWQPAQDGPGGEPPASLDLVQVTGRELRQVLDDLLGTGPEVPGERGP